MAVGRVLCVLLLLLLLLASVVVTHDAYELRLVQGVLLIMQCLSFSLSLFVFLSPFLWRRRKKADDARWFLVLCPLHADSSSSSPEKNHCCVVCCSLCVSPPPPPLDCKVCVFFFLFCGLAVIFFSSS